MPTMQGAAERFEPKLPPINLYSMAPAWVFYAQQQSHKKIRAAHGGSMTTNNGVRL